jgi:Asp-tRNA(Asn)/Glu-tRNA(Gln) amidotransferase A subunit family amidase
MENDRDKLVVVLAGYADRMDAFFQMNPGMGSRIAHHIDFPDYRRDELVAIGQLMLEQQRYALSPEAEPVFRRYVERRMAMPRFANARSIRNALERARLRQANRLVDEGGRVTREALTRIEASDLLKSPVFADALPDDSDALPSPVPTALDRQAAN